ncbi:hypothetical protein Tco_0342073, partial [Tanacetum coccineum]
VSHLSQLALAYNSIHSKDMLVVLFDKDVKLVWEMHTLTRELSRCVKERGELILELERLSYSFDAYESVKQLKEL